uniref:MADF domain-containing protein n=1 Tax=Daphnia galeata TaxID=27404 RepID=A0A8J2WLC4_9CRUS|nr:unnamed protein product [Daphnia galeata]
MEIESNLLKNKWVFLIDNKTNKEQIWNDIATGFLVRGEDKCATCRTKWENLRKDYRTYISKFNQSGSTEETTIHTGHPTLVTLSTKKTQNTTKFKDTIKEIASQEEQRNTQGIISQQHTEGNCLSE